jgi:hypothetical protein
MHHSALSPKEVPVIISKYTFFTLKKLGEVVPAGPPMTLALKDLVLRTSFNAAAKALFGSAIPADLMFDYFVRFDNKMHLLAAKLPSFMTIEPRKAWDVVISYLHRYLEKPHDDASHLVHATERIAKDAGWVSSSPSLSVRSPPTLTSNLIDFEGYSSYPGSRSLGIRSQCYLGGVLGYCLSAP